MTKENELEKNLLYFIYLIFNFYFQKFNYSNYCMLELLNVFPQINF